MNLLQKNLPGTEIVLSGLFDISEGKYSKYSFLLQCARTRLKDIGIDVGKTLTSRDPSLVLFEILKLELGNGAHSMYNALNRELLSFIKAAERETRD